VQQASVQDTINGKTYTIQLVNVDSSGNTVISVQSPDGIIASDTIAKGSTRTINGVQIYVKSSTSKQH